MLGVLSNEFRSAKFANVPDAQKWARMCYEGQGAYSFQKPLPSELAKCLSEAQQCTNTRAKIISTDAKSKEHKWKTKKADKSSNRLQPLKTKPTGKGIKSVKNGKDEKIDDEDVDMESDEKMDEESDREQTDAKTTSNARKRKSMSESANVEEGSKSDIEREGNAFMAAMIKKGGRKETTMQGYKGIYEHLRRCEGYSMEQIGIRQLDRTFGKGKMAGISAFAKLYPQIKAKLAELRPTKTKKPRTQVNSDCFIALMTVI